MTSLIKASLRYPAVTLILTAVIVAIGIHALLTMPRMEDPSITVRTGLVLALYPGATSAQVEKQVTSVLEERILRFPEVRKEKTFSTSRPGLVVINVELQGNVTNADVFWSKLRHELNVVGASELPRGVRGPIVNSDFGDTVALLVAVHGKPYGYRELHDYVDRIQDELRTVGDVGKLVTYGEQSEQIWITSSLERLSQYITDPLRIIQALQQRNIILPSGDVDTDASAIPLRTTGLFTTEDQIRNVLVDVSRTGQPVYIRDFAEVERRYQDPTFLVRYDGERTILISVEMQKGRNIVQMGEKVDQALSRLRNVLPPDLQLDLIANQPNVVRTRIRNLSHEFLLAIGSVILVTMILLPMRVAAIAALAIPVTICATLGVMNAIGIQLHQVSIAALIVVLGIVVDDAIVIADNYVDLLDRGVGRSEAAWRSASEVVVPVLTATLTIIASFLPLLVLSGSAGEFISALPITVAIALSVSFLVAILLTPMLCRFFIRKGLHDPSQAPKKFNVLDRLQGTYNRSIVFFMRRRLLAMLVGFAAVGVGVVLYGTAPQQFFPSAERNQFVIDVWMPQGTRIEATDAVMQRIEKALRSRKQIVHFAAFVGQSAPRFYYNVNPQQPDSAYGQFIVNAETEEQTPELVIDLRNELAGLVPEALVVVKELQQGQLMEAPVEVRLIGEDIETLQTLGRNVEEIARGTGIAQLVHNDYFNDSLLVDINVNDEVANRLGISNAIVSQLLAGAFSGAPVSTFWEGNRAVTLLLRLEEQRRQTFEDVRNTYVPSPVTRASVPLRSLANLEPQWQTSRIVRRNGVRTLTVRAFPKHGHYASELLRKVNQKLQQTPLPPGVRVEFGGEKANRDETFPQMLTALSISVVAIFLVLLLQFRTISDPLIIMCSIPLALFGAMFGLVLTRNPFGFTAFMGLISLCGIVVRNAIILVEYIHEKMREGSTLELAATQAGERRLRPIFLTTMAAAVGVTPMILSGSSLWSPLASAIAVGLVFSMFFTLLVVPVLFVIVRTRFPKAQAGLAILLILAMPLNAGTRRLTLDQALELAYQQNSGLKIARARVRENEQKQVTARANYFPQLSSDANLWTAVNSQLISIPAGGFGYIPPIGPIPSERLDIAQGSTSLFFTNTTLTQPLTQILKIREGNRIAAAERRVSEAELRKARNDVTLGVYQLYYGLLAARKQREAVAADVLAKQEQLRESGDAVRSGTALDVAVTGGRAALLQARQTALVLDNRIEDLTDEMNALIGLPLGTELELAEIGNEVTPSASLDEYRKSGLSTNPEIVAAMETVDKARSGVQAAKYEYIPEVGAFGMYTYQNGVPFLTRNNGTLGVRMTWNIFDWGKRKGVVGQREALLEQAEQNLRRLKDQVSVEIEKAYRKLDRSHQLMEVTTEALALRRESERITGNQLKAGVASQAKQAEAAAATRKAEADDLQARLGYRLAQAEMERITGLQVH